MHVANGMTFFGRSIEPHATVAKIPTSKLFYSHSRAACLADGRLIDVTPFAKVAGFGIPVAVTAAVFRGHVACRSAWMREAKENYEENQRLFTMLCSANEAPRRWTSPSSEQVWLAQVQLRKPNSRRRWFKSDTDILFLVKDEDVATLFYAHEVSE